MKFEGYTLNINPRFACENTQKIFLRESKHVSKGRNMPC